LDNGSNPATISNTNGNITTDFDTINAGRNYTIQANSINAFRIANGGDISFYEDTGTTAKFFWDASAESLGIGTDSPNQLLHLDNSASSSDSAAIRIISGTAGTARILLGDTGYGSRGRVLYDNSDDSLQLWGADGTTSTERMRIDSSGNLLVGKTAVGVANAGIELRANNLAAVSRSGDNCLYLNRITDDGSILELRKDNVVVGNIGTANSGDLYIGNDDTTLLFAGGSDAIIPRGTAGATRDGAISLGLSSHRFNNFHLSGTASIGNLTIAGAQGTDGQVLTSTGSGIAWEDASGGATDINGLSDAKTFGTGSIMLGDTTTGTLSNANYNVGVGVDMLNSLTSGYANIAIGFESCKDLTTGHNNVAVGHATLYENIGGEQNVAVGANALQNNTEGDNNVAIGKSALVLNTASNNTAVGWQALKTTTTATQVTALGYRAGEDSTGSSSTFIGYLAGAETSTGGQNTFIGASVAESGVCTGIQNTLVGGNNATGITSGENNTVLGTHAARNLTTGAGHVAIGTHARRLATGGNNGVYVGLYSGYNHTAGRSVYVGEYAGYDATSSDDSVHVGRLAGQNVTTGYTNVCMGDRALNAATTAYGITAIGYKAGDNVGTGNYSVYIGAQADSPQTDHAGEVVIGAGAGKGSNTGFITPNSGVYQGNNSSSWSTTSDRRIKKNITDNSAGLEIINDIRVRNFEYRTKEEITELGDYCAVDKQGVQLGVIAQELQEVLPESVTEVNTGCLQVNSDNITWHLVNAVKELSAKVKELEEQLNG